MVNHSSYDDEISTKKVKIIPEVFGLLKMIGLWQPTEWKSPLIDICYIFYTHFTFGIIISLMISQIVAVVFYTNSLEDFSETSYVLLSTLNATVKGITILLRRKQTLGLINILHQDACIPKNEEERNVCESFNLISRFTVLLCIALATMTISILIIRPLIFQDIDGDCALPLKTWYPFDLSSNLKFWLSYLHQMVGLYLIAAYDIANDTVITGFMNIACAQLELIALRFKKITWASSVAVEKKMSDDWVRMEENKVIKQCVHHHLLFFRFIDEINKTFAPSILTQYCLSSIVLCITVYQLCTGQSDWAQIIFVTFYLISMLVEFFIYCWFGNEVTVKSLGFSAMLLDIDWTVIHTKTYKELLIIIMRSSTPVFLSCGPPITLSLTSFTGVVKISYSAFNVLKRSY